MNTIKRDVYVLRNTIKIPIEVTKGTDMVGIEFTVRDFDIPATAAAVAYSYNRKMKKQNSQLCDVKGNVISFTPGREFFEVGMNELQIRVINEDKALISFKEKVKCSDAMEFPDDEEEKQQTLIEQLLSNSGKETGELNIGKEALDYEVCCAKTYKEDTVPDDISVGNMVSIINTECTYELAYETKEVKEKKDTKRKGMISFIDDDTTSCKYVKDYHDIFEGTGVCGTYAVMTRRMTDGGTDPEDSSYHYRYDDEGELLELLKTYEMEGFGMVLHCYWQNDTHESTRYFNVATRDIQKCRENMLRGLREYRELGFQNADLWVTPYGVQDTEIQNLAKELGLECLISMSNNTIISEDYRNRWCIPRYSISTTSDQDYLKEQMRTAVEKGGWINIVTHANSWKSADYEMMKNKVREIIAYAKEIGLEIGTFGKCYNEWKSVLYENEARYISSCANVILEN